MSPFDFTCRSILLIVVYHFDVETASSMDPRSEPLLLPHVEDDVQRHSIRLHQATGTTQMAPDCWENCLQFASTPNELGNFRGISKRHLEIHDDLMESQQTNNLRRFITMNKEEYPAMETLIPSSIVFPGSVCSLNYSQFIASLRRFHNSMEQDIVRWSRPSTPYDIVSIALQTTACPSRLIYVGRHNQEQSMLLVLLFDESGLNNTRYCIDDDEVKIDYDFDIFDLNQLLVTGYWGDGHNLWIRQSESKQCRYSKRCYYASLLCPWFILIMSCLMAAFVITVRHEMSWMKKVILFKSTLNCLW